MFGHKNSYKTFGKVIIHILIGAIVGILAGFILGLLVWGLNSLVEVYANSFAPAQIYTMLGMGWGAVVGGVFGGIIGLKEK